MTAKQRLFAEEYVRDRDPRRAYKAAYSRVKSDAVADACAGRLLGDARCREVQEYIRELIDKATDAAVADVHEVLVFLTQVMRGEQEEDVMCDGVVCAKGLPGRDRLKAAEMLAKYHQMFVQRQEVEVSGGGLIVLQEATDGEY